MLPASNAKTVARSTWCGTYLVATAASGPSATVASRIMAMPPNTFTTRAPEVALSMLSISQ